MLLSSRQTIKDSQISYRRRCLCVRSHVLICALTVCFLNLPPAKYERAFVRSQAAASIAQILVVRLSCSCLQKFAAFSFSLFFSLAIQPVDIIIMFITLLLLLPLFLPFAVVCILELLDHENCEFKTSINDYTPSQHWTAIFYIDFLCTCLFWADTYNQQIQHWWRFALWSNWKNICHLTILCLYTSTRGQKEG